MKEDRLIPVTKEKVTQFDLSVLQGELRHIGTLLEAILEVLRDIRRGGPSVS